MVTRGIDQPIEWVRDGMLEVTIFVPYSYDVLPASVTSYTRLPAAGVISAFERLKPLPCACAAARRLLCRSCSSARSGRSISAYARQPAPTVTTEHQQVGHMGTRRLVQMSLDRDLQQQTFHGQVDQVELYEALPMKARK